MCDILRWGWYHRFGHGCQPKLGKTLGNFSTKFRPEMQLIPLGMFYGKMPENSIAFGSAPQREAGSQPISQLARLAVSQAETHSVDFLSVADGFQAVGRTYVLRASFWANGNAADQRLFGRRFESQSGEHGGAVPPTTVDQRGFEPPT